MENTEEKKPLSSQARSVYKDTAKKTEKVSFYISPLWILLSIYLIIVGSIKLDACDVEPMIPVWAISYGTVYLASTCWSLFYYGGPNRASTKSCFENHSSLLALLDATIVLGRFALLIAGCVWVFRTRPSYNPDSSHYCDELMYKSAFAAAILPFVVYAILLGLLVFLCICGCCCGLTWAACAACCGDDDGPMTRAANTTSKSKVVIEENVALNENRV